MNCPNDSKEPALHGVTENDVKEAIKKLLKNTPKWKVEKNANDANDMINTTNDDYNLELHRVNHLYGLILRHHEFIFS